MNVVNTEAQPTMNDSRRDGDFEDASRESCRYKGLTIMEDNKRLQMSNRLSITDTVLLSKSYTILQTRTQSM